MSKNIILDFYHPHTPGTAADEKRKGTQLDWAYDSDEIYELGGVYYQKGADRVYDYPQSKWIYTPYDKPIDLEVAPKIWDNVPLSGFKIIDTVNRHRGNKLFKVMDPRGIEFEITAYSLFGIIQDGEIKEGEILSKCVWLKGKDLIVVK